jgi:autotransporter-associated beta strand protein
MQKSFLTRALFRSLRPPSRFGFLARATVPALLAGTAWGASVTWDPANNLAGSDGSGTWSTGVANWASGGSDAGWVNGDSAIFGSGGTAGTVSVSGAVNVADIFFGLTTGNYTVSDGTIGFGATGTITTNSSAAITSILSGSGTVLTKAGAGTLTVNGASSGISSIDVTAGTLATDAGGALSFGNSSTAISVSSGASIKVASGAVAGNAMTFNGGSGTAAEISGATLAGPITLASGNTAFNVSSQSGEITGNISGSGSFTKSGANQLTLKGVNTYSGTTTVTDGSLLVDSSSSIGTGSVVNNGVIRFNVASGATVTLSNAVSGSGAISKTGAGTFVMDGAYTYSGATTLAGGTTIFNGSITDANSTATLVVGSGSTLKGAGTIVGASAGALSLLAGGKFSIGATDGAIGTFSATSFAWFSDNTNASMFFDLSSSDGSADMLALTGSFSRSSGTSYIIDFQGGGVAGQTYTLISYGVASSVSVGNLVATNLASGLTGTFKMTGATSGLNSAGVLTFTVVPEPTEVGIGIAALAAFAIVMRRRRQTN